MDWFKRSKGTRAQQSPAERSIRSALLFVLDGDFNQSESVLRSIVEKDARDIDVYLALGRIYRERGEIGRAISLHETLVLRSDLTRTQRLEARSQLALDYHMGGFLPRAEEAYAAVRRLDRRNLQALWGLQDVALARGDLEAAWAWFRRRMRRKGVNDPGNGLRIALSIARRERDSGRSQSARSWVQRALRIDEQCIAALLLSIELDVERGRTASALSTCVQATELNPERSEEIYRKLRSVLRRSGQAARLTRLLKRQVAKRPQDLALKTELARALLSEGQVAAAAAESTQVVDREPLNLAAHVLRNRALIQMQQEDPAVDTTKAYSELLETLDSIGTTADEGSGPSP